MRRKKLAIALAAVATTVASAGAVAAPNASAEVWTFRCTTAKWSDWAFCKAEPKLAIHHKRWVGVRLLDSGDNNPIKIQVRKGKDVRWESKWLKPDGTEDESCDKHEISGADKFKPDFWAKSDEWVRTAFTLKLRVQAERI